jgi:hypothetical protein
MADDKALNLPCRASIQMISRGTQARYILTWLSRAQDEVLIGTACSDSHRLSGGAVRQYSGVAYIVMAVNNPVCVQLKAIWTPACTTSRFFLTSIIEQKLA